MLPAKPGAVPACPGAALLLPVAPAEPVTSLPDPLALDPMFAEPGVELAVPAELFALDPGEFVADVFVSAGEFVVLFDDADGVLDELSPLSLEDDEPDCPAAVDEEDDEPAPDAPAPPDWADATTVNEPTANAAEAMIASVFRDNMEWSPKRV